MLDVQVKSKVYRGAAGKSHASIRDIAFTLERGMVGAIVGPSGCGKTTLLRLIAGLDTDFDGAVLRPESDALALVFQEPRLLPWRNVEDNIRIAAPHVNESELAGLFEALSLTAHRHHYPGELSLGLARRVALVRALALQLELLLLDEPFASLDKTMADRLLSEISMLVEIRPVTTLLVTHELETAIRLADRIFVLSQRPATLVTTINIDTPRQRMSAEALEHIRGLIAEAQHLAPPIHP